MVVHIERSYGKVTWESHCRCQVGRPQQPGLSPAFLSRVQGAPRLFVSPAGAGPPIWLEVCHRQLITDNASTPSNFWFLHHLMPCNAHGRIDTRSHSVDRALLGAGGWRGIQGFPERGLMYAGGRHCVSQVETSAIPHCLMGCFFTLLI